jgi:hypothetical protein
MCKTGLKFGQTAQLFAAGDTVSAKAKLVLSAGKGDSDAVDVPQAFGTVCLVVQQNADISLSRSTQSDERQPEQRV